MGERLREYLPDPTDSTASPSIVLLGGLAATDRDAICDIDQELGSDAVVPGAACGDDEAFPIGGVDVVAVAHGLGAGEWDRAGLGEAVVAGRSVPVARLPEIDDRGEGGGRRCLRTKE